MTKEIIKRAIIIPRAFSQNKNIKIIKTKIGVVCLHNDKEAKIVKNENAPRLSFELGVPVRCPARITPAEVRMYK
jgi:hypothetical protein